MKHIVSTSTYSSPNNWQSEEFSHAPVREAAAAYSIIKVSYVSTGCSRAFLQSRSWSSNNLYILPSEFCPYQGAERLWHMCNTIYIKILLAHSLTVHFECGWGLDGMAAVHLESVHLCILVALSATRREERPALEDFAWESCNGGDWVLRLDCLDPQLGRDARTFNVTCHSCPVGRPGTPLCQLLSRTNRDFDIHRPLSLRCLPPCFSLKRGCLEVTY